MSNTLLDEFKEDKDCLISEANFRQQYADTGKGEVTLVDLLELQLIKLVWHKGGYFLFTLTDKGRDY